MALHLRLPVSRDLEHATNNLTMDHVKFERVIVFEPCDRALEGVQTKVDQDFPHSRRDHDVIGEELEIGTIFNNTTLTCAFEFRIT